jgi:hypothetical protein
MKKKLFLVLLFLVAEITLFAQINEKQSFSKDIVTRKKINTKFNELYIQNSEIGYLTFPYTQVGSRYDYVLTGYIVPHYYVFPTDWRISLVITPAVRIRIMDDKSFPVRTPSYMPGGTFYFKLNRDTAHYKYLSVALFYHSNGQDGLPLNPDGSINTYNGNFGTNFVEVALNFGSESATKNRYFKLGVEAHSRLIDQWSEPAFKGRYSNLRVNYKISGSKYITRFADFVKTKALKSPTTKETKELWRTVFEGMVSVDSDANLDWDKMVNAELKIYRKIGNSPNTSWFLSAGYIGHDYYNVYFEHSYPVFRFGLAAGSSFLQRTKSKTEFNEE